MNGKDEYGLTLKQRKFADLYLSGMFATQALKEAGYRNSDERRGAWTMLQSPALQNYVKVQRERMAEMNGIDRAQLVNWLWRAVMTPVSEVGENSDLLEGEIVKNFQNGATVKQVRMVSKLGAAKQLSKMLGWNAPEQHEVKVEPVDEFAAFMRRLRARNAAEGAEQ